MAKHRPIPGVLSGARRNGAHRLLSLIAIFAILVQSFVVQTHVHGASALVTEIQSSASASSAAQTGDWFGAVVAQSPQEEGAVCAICQQMALAGAVVLPTTQPLQLIETSAIENTAIVSVALVSAFSSHNWRSRAPPLQP